MHKLAMKAIRVTTATFAAFVLAGQVFAGSMSIKIESPKTPTNQNNLNINFVILDSASGGSITAKCFKKGPGEGIFAQFGSDIAIDAGGNQANCVTNSTLMNADGTYQFYVVATNGPETVTSDTVSVDYKTGGPETPTNYSREGVTSCSWKIKFHTANDGKTAKVELYRSESTSFNTDSGTRIASQNIGPNTDGEFVTDKPDCAKTYYYAIRAFDSIGNGSGVVGDSETHTVNTTVVTSSGASGTVGAIAGGNQGNILGTSNGASGGSTGTSGGILGEASVSGTPTPTQASYTPPAPMSKKPFIYGGITVVVIGLLVWFFKKKSA